MKFTMEVLLFTLGFSQALPRANSKIGNTVAKVTCALYRKRQ